MDGIYFHSKKEAGRYVELKLLERSGIITGLELQKRFNIYVNGQHICAYVADFVYIEKGNQVVEDVKGMKRGTAWAMYRIKKKLMKAVLGIEIKEI